MSCPGCGASDREPYFEKDGFRLVRCRSCGLVSVANPPSDEELERFYSRRGGYHLDVLGDTPQAARLERLARRHLGQLRVRVRPTGRLLDVGCASGAFLRAAREEGFNAVGVERNRDTAAAARALGLEVRDGTIEQAGFPAVTFDVVTFWDVIEHLPDPASALLEAARILRPGGTVAFSTPNVDGLFPRLSGAVGRRVGYWTHPEPPAHLHQFSVTTLARLLERCGFRVDAVAHDRSPLKYSLAPGGFRLLLRSPGRLLYAVAFALPLLLGPPLQSGDEITVIAKRRQ